MSTSAREEVSREDGRWFRASQNPHAWPVSSQVWVDMEQVKADNEGILDLARRFSRLTLLALTGLLVETEAFEVNQSDLRLIQEVAAAADIALSEAGKRYLADDGTERAILREPVRRAGSS